MGIVEHLRVFFNTTAHAIEVQPSELTGLKKQFGDMDVDDDCEHKVTAESPVVTGQTLNTSSLMFGISKLNWTTANIFADAKMDVQTDLKIVAGQHWSVFGKSHCTTLGQKTVGAHIVSSGTVGIGANASCSNARIEKASATNTTGLDLVFDF